MEIVMEHTCTSCGGQIDHQAHRVDFACGSYRHFDREDCSTALRWSHIPDVLGWTAARRADRAAQDAVMLEPGDDHQQALWLTAIKTEGVR